ncbi:MAG: hypothetical protein ACYCW6_06230 [Candidatus Xenobia bacterium]
MLDKAGDEQQLLDNTGDERQLLDKTDDEPLLLAAPERGRGWQNAAVVQRLRTVVVC